MQRNRRRTRTIRAGRSSQLGTKLFALHVNSYGSKQIDETRLTGLHETRPTTSLDEMRPITTGLVGPVETFQTNSKNDQLNSYDTHKIEHKIIFNLLLGINYFIIYYANISKFELVKTSLDETRP